MIGIAIYNNELGFHARILITFSYLKADADLSAKSRESIAAAKSKGDTSRNMVPVGSVKMVMAGSGCDNKQKVEQVICRSLSP